MRTTVLKQRTFLFDTHFNQIMSHIVMSQFSKFQQKVDACLFISSQNDHDDSSVLWVTDGLYRVRLKESFLQPKVHNPFGNKSPSLISEGHKSQKGSGKKDVRCRCQRSDTLRGKRELHWQIRKDAFFPKYSGTQRCRWACVFFFCLVVKCDWWWRFNFVKEFVTLESCFIYGVQ